MSPQSQLCNSKILPKQTELQNGKQHESMELCEHFQTPLESINSIQSFADDMSILSRTKITGHESSKHLQESANETAKSMMTRSLIKAAHLFPLSTHPHQGDQ